ncbi:2740_t:CDS:2 [Ambispora gerdemannii]|uniref:2740_t:CDS:1 n=1 Tax=Ambispora gerdemannii TaxID=144530 RepID=A0A9N9C1F7_9GLOM|nr:2740_t:CDS:2 [Ambispora gerdemannii]
MVQDFLDHTFNDCGAVFTDSFAWTVYLCSGFLLPRDHTRYHPITSTGQITPPVSLDSYDTTSQLLLPTKSFLAKFIVKRLHIYFGKWLLYASLGTFVENFQPKTYEKFYIYRVLEVLRNVIFGGDYKEDLGITFHELFWYYACSGVLYFSMNYMYESLLLNSTFLLYALLPADQKNSTTSTTINKNTPTINNTTSKLLRLSPEQQIKIRGWCTHMIFYSPTFFSNPEFSHSPRDLWTNRWHQCFKEQFKQLAFHPTRKLTIRFGGGKKLSWAIGVISSFLLSGLMHEYVLYAFKGNEDKAAGHQFLFFVVQAVLFVTWEMVERAAMIRGGKSENDQKEEASHDDSREKKPSWIKIIIWNMILICTVPLFIEPYRGRTHCTMHFYCGTQ